MRVAQISAVGPVMHHEQPPANPLLGCVQGVACDCLLNLSQQGLRIADEEIANVCAALEFHMENVDPNANHGALQLHKTSIEGGAAIHGGEEAERAFAPNVCRLDRRP